MHGVVATAVALLVLLALSPDSPVFPPCPIKQLLGLECPGCGATRAAAALLHGHLREALRQNALFVCVIPWMAFSSGRAYYRALTESASATSRNSQCSVFAALGVATLFTIARNL